MRLDSQLSRMNCHTFSTGLSSGQRGGKHKGDVVGHDQFSRTMPSRLIKQQDSVCARRDVEGDFFQMHRHASLLQRGMTMPAPFPSAGQIAPKIHAEDRR